jgi:hypothetical protein
MAVDEKTVRKHCCQLLLAISHPESEIGFNPDVQFFSLEPAELWNLYIYIYKYL